MDRFDRFSSARSCGPLHRLALAVLVLLAPVFLSACSDNAPWHNTDLSGAMPQLAFTMTDADTGKTVTAADFPGKVVLLYFGYTFCPDICPTTLSNLALVLKKLGAKANDAQVLFVTVDPNRDTLPVLKQYTAAFAPQIVGLRGDANALAALARRYRVSYSVTPASDGHPYEVTHSSAIYVFDKTGAVRLLVSSMATGKPDIDGTAADIRRLIDASGRSGFFGWISRLV